MELLAWARIFDDTEIQYAICAGETIELSIGGSEGLTIETTQRGLLNLLSALAGALQAYRATYGSAA